MATEANGRTDIYGGLLLVTATLAALVMANSPLSGFYDLLLSTRIDFRIAPEGGRLPAFEIAKPLTLWINDGLMAVFFFLVGMEIKREVLAGHLASVQRAALPAIGAVGGVIAPALIYLAVARADPSALRGWAIPMATDIAFAVAVAVALGRAVPPAAKVFLLALAIIDDLMAIVAIALFYTAKLSVISMALGGLGVALLAVLNLAGVRRLAPYIVVGVFTWACVLKSGVHATLAGVALGFAIPLARRPDGSTLLEDTEHALKPWITFGVMPVFAFANAGVSFAGMSLATLAAPVPLGIVLGLFLGKQIGVFGFAWAAVKLRLGAMPPGVTWRQFHGVALLCGIGFTMSLFIGSLAFDSAEDLAQVRLGVLVGSLLSVIAAVAVLARAAPAPAVADEHRV